MFNDLREFIREAEQLGEVRIIEGADWDLEIGAITELGFHCPVPPLILFDKIKGYPQGYRVATIVFDHGDRLALALGLPLGLTDLQQARAWRDKISGGFKPVPPVEVKSGPVLENVHTGDDINIFEFPIPKYHELDGGRYIGTGHMVIQKDPDTGWVNFGTYRVQAQDKNTATIHIVPGHHGDVIARKYWERGQACPVAVVCGEDPTLFNASITEVPFGVNEYDYVGWLRGKPVEVIRGRTVDLPIPAAAEIVLEGDFVPMSVESRMEGPFGEWEGYYAGGTRPHPVLRVKAVLHRNDPIIVGAPPSAGPYYYGEKIVTQAGFLWHRLDKELPGVKGVWYVPYARGWQMAVISIKQQYPGHAKHAAMFAAGTYGASAIMGKYIVVVDEDIDPSNIADVIWAIATRCDPQTDIDIMGGCTGMASDPRLAPEKRERGDAVCSRAIIYACKPYAWMKQFPPSVARSPEVLAKVQEKWGKLLMGQSKGVKIPSA